MIEQKISPNWQFLAKISYGSFGEIYKILNKKTNKTAALKIFNPDLQNRKILIKTNFQAACEINHKNCLKMIEWVETEIEFGFIMEFVDGKPITILKDQPVSEIINSFIKICNGLDAIHSRNLIHRDLKSSNILLTENREVKITDFDFLKTAKNIIEKDEYLGSVRYSSPEQCIDPKTVDQRSDLYSLGIILFEIFTGKFPFDGKSWEEIASKKIRSEFSFPKKIKELFPDSIVAIIQKLLQRKMEDRYQNAKQLAIALKSCLPDTISETIDAESNFLLSPYFIDRKEHLEILEKTFLEVQKDHSRAILISGEKGVGKTRLLKEFIDPLFEDQSIIRTKASPSQNRALIDIISKIIKNIEQESKTIRKKILQNNIPVLVRLIPELKKSLFYRKNDHPDLNQEKVLAVISDTIRSYQIFLKKPLLLIFEDIQFADDLTCKWIAGVKNKNAGILLILTFNPSEIKRTIFEKEILNKPIYANSIKINIENFDLKHTFLMIDSILGNESDLKPKTIKKIYFLSNGNPLYISELMKFFHKKNYLKLKKGKWKIDEKVFSSIQIPEKIVKILKYELTKLSVNSLKILKYISLFGNNFSYNALCSVLDFEQKEIFRCLEEALSSQIIEQNIETGEYSFCKDLYRRSLEEIPSKKEKLKFYQKIARFYEEKYFGNEDVEVEKIADFYDKAEDQEKSIKYLDLAARFCKQNYSYGKTIAYLKKLIKILEKQKNKEKLLADYYLKLGKIQREEDMKKAEASFLAALKLSEKIEDLELMVESNANLGWLNVMRGHLEKSLFYYEKRAKLAEKVQDKSIRARAYAGLANIYNRINRYDESITDNKKYIKLSEEIGKQDNVCIALQNIGSAYYHKNDHSNALAYLKKSLEIARKINHLSTISNIYGLYGLIYLEKGEFEKSLKYFSDNIKFALQTHNKRSLSIAYGNMANTYTKIGNFKKAVELFEKQLEIDEDTGDERGICLGSSNLANVYKKLNLFQKAETLYERAIETGRRLKLNYFLCSFLQKKADLYFIMEKLKESEILNNEALEIAQKVKRDKIIIVAEILKSKIIFKTEQNNQKKISALTILYKLAEKTAEKKDIALLNYEIFKLTNSDFHKQEAIRIYDELFEKYHLFEDEKKLEEMKSKKFKKITKQDSSSISLVQSLVKFMNPETAYSELLKYLTKECKADNCQIVNYDRRTGKFETLAVSPTLDINDLDFSETILRESIKTNKIHFLQNAVESSQFRDNRSIIGKSFLSVIVVPIISGGSTKGALYLDRRNIKQGTFLKEDLEKVKTIANIISPILSKKDEIEQYKIKAEVQNLGFFIGNSREMQNLYKEIYYAAKVDSTVYIYGESGTGKELVARALHNLSKRQKNRFVAINCAAIPHELAESELFGHEKGAFTGAVVSKKGKFELANNGTLFLDEIGELPLTIQAKLLRVLEEKEITCLGGMTTIPVNVRIITATQKILEKEVINEKFRKDLLHRLNILKIDLPPLRERKEDIPLLAEYFLSQFCEQYEKTFMGFSVDAMQILVADDWKENNVRELRNVIERAFIPHESDFPITAKELFKDKINFPKKIGSGFEMLSGDGLEDIIGKLECDVIKQTLDKNNWNKTKTAEELKIGRPRIDKIINKYDLRKDSA